MSPGIFNSIDLMFVCTVFFVGVASPGPSNLAIMTAAVNYGRIPSLLLAAGIVCGSLFWGILAAFGLATVLATFSNLLLLMKIAAGSYLLWLAYKSGKSAMSSGKETVLDAKVEKKGYLNLFLSGVTLHLTNPKAIFVWLSIVSIAQPNGMTMQSAFAVVFFCGVISATVFISYALLFSTKYVRNLYLKIRRGFDGVLCLCFGYAGVRMLFNKAFTQSA